MDKLFFLTTIVLFFNSISFAFNSIEGHYDCKWLDTNSGGIVRGIMIINKSGQTYSMKSKYNDTSSYIGTGIYNQTKRNFSLVFYNPKDSNETGVATVDINVKSINPIWTWAYVNKTTLEHTTCIKRIA